MFGFDGHIAALSDSGAPLVAVLVALLLGLRHAGDPDHLVAVSTLVASSPRQPGRQATLLGLCWGLGHATTLLGLGLPLALSGAVLPPALQGGAEALVGLLVAAFALQLVRRWRAGRFHVHVHAHDGRVHRHLHRHGRGAEAVHPAPEEHRHEHEPARRPAQSFAVGLVHGVAGSAPAALLVVAAAPGRATAVASLAAFAAAAALSMTLLSSAVGYALARGPVLRRFRTLAPALGLLSLAFGGWYAASAFEGLT